VGIFDRKVPAKNLALNDEEKCKYLAGEIANAIEAEFRRLEESIEQRIAEGIHSQEFEEFESKSRMSLVQICKFINRLLGEDISNLGVNECVSPTWTKLKKLIDGLAAVNSPKANHLVADFEEACTYFADSVKSGSFIMMPGATIDSSHAYRAYLLGNKLNGDNNWGWEKADKSPQEIADDSVSQFLGLFVTNVHDKVGPSKILTGACMLVIVLSAAWETAPERNLTR